MNGLDTDVPVRYLVQDDVGQSAAAGKRIEAETTLTFDRALRLSPLFEVLAG